MEMHVFITFSFLKLFKVSSSFARFAYLISFPYTHRVIYVFSVRSSTLQFRDY